MRGLDALEQAHGREHDPMIQPETFVSYPSQITVTISITDPKDGSVVKAVYVPVSATATTKRICARHDTDIDDCFWSYRDCNITRTDIVLELRNV